MSNYSYSFYRDKKELQDRIAHYKIPKYWKFVSEFPMTISGKIRKVEMREIAARELGLEPEE